MITPMIAPDTPVMIAMLVFDEDGDGDDEDGNAEDGPVLPETLGAGVSGSTSVGGTLTGDAVNEPRSDGVGTGDGTVVSTGNEEGCGEGPLIGLGEDSQVDGWKEVGTGVGIGVESDGECVGEDVQYELLPDPVLSSMMTAKSADPAETSSQSP